MDGKIIKTYPIRNSRTLFLFLFLSFHGVSLSGMRIYDNPVIRTGAVFRSTIFLYARVCKSIAKEQTARFRHGIRSSNGTRVGQSAGRTAANR